MAVALGGGAPHPGVRALCLVVVLAGCGASRIPATLRGYEILVERTDPEGAEMARALRQYGFRVRGAVRGGSRATAALVFFTYRDPEPGSARWLHVRLADTRSGEIVGAAQVPLDSIEPTPRARADAAIQALLAKRLSPAP